MKTSVAFGNMAKALPYAAELLDCADVKAAKKLMMDEKNTSTGALLMQLMPVFLTEKPGAVYGLLGALDGKSPEEIAEQDWAKTVKLLSGAAFEDMLRFFIFALRMARNA